MPGFDLGAWPPVLVADKDRRVHAFSSQWINFGKSDSTRAIVYNQWSLERGWSEPIDVLLSPVKESRVTDAYLGANGIMHVVFWGGDNTDSNIYYSQAPIINLENALSWSAPIIVGENAGDPEGAVIIEDLKGNLHIVFNGRQFGNGLYVVDSMDGGKTWSGASPIFIADFDKPNIDKLHLIRGESGLLHAVWGVYNEAGQGRGIYYSNSRSGNEWSDPVLLDYAPDGLGTQDPTIIEYDASLIVIYIMPPKITMRRSIDNGTSWQQPSVIFPRHVGVNGSLSPVVDGNDELHLFFGQRITGNPDIHGMWHSVWNKVRWTEPEAIINGPSVNDPDGNKSFDPFEARAVVSQGNVILVTWRTDPGLKGNGVWYSYQVLDAPELPLETYDALVTPTTTVSSVPTSNVADWSTTGNDPTPEIDVGIFKDQPSSIGSEVGFPLIVGIILVGVFIVGIFVFIKPARK